jgi:hypothetical protein
MPCVRARPLILFLVALCWSCVLVSCSSPEGPDRTNSPVSPGPSESGPDVTPRYTPTEMHVMRLMRRAGARDVGQAEPAHGDSDADISGLWRGVEILVVGYPSHVREPEGKTLESHGIGGTRVIELSKGGRRKLVLECRGFIYEASKFPGNRWDTQVMGSFASSLADAAGCSEPAPIPTRFVPTRIEKTVIELLRQAGARDVGVAEHGFKSADISGTWMGVRVYVQAYPSARADIHDGKREIVGETKLEGQFVLDARQFGRRQLLFACEGSTYEIQKGLEGRWDADLMMSFVAALIRAGC